MSVSIGTYASRPSSHSAGDIYLTTDSFWDYLVSDGSKWQHLYSGFECEPPIDSEFSWVNQGGASVTTTNGGVFMHAPADASTNYRIRVKSAPTAPYTLTAILLPSIVGLTTLDRLSAGVCFRQSSNGHLGMIHFTSYSSNSIEVRIHNSPTDGGTAAAIYYLDPNISAPAIWLRLEDNGTNENYSFSLDSQNFIQIYSDSTTHLNPADQIGFLINAQNSNYDVDATLIHWSQPNPISTLKVRSFFFCRGMASGYGSGNTFGAFG